MLSAFTNCLKIPELREKILFTLGLLFVARVGANIPIPGLNPQPLQNYFAEQAGGGALGLYNMFTGGALLNGAVFGLGIMPYISASIIFQLMGAVVPSIARLQQEGDIGRQKISQYTRYLTIGIALVQGTLLSIALVNGSVFPGFDAETYGEIVLISHGWFIFTAIILLTAGTIIMMWLGEQITQQGIGNGISLLITVGILADLPQALMLAYQLINKPAGMEGADLGVPQAMLMILLLVLVIAGITAVTQATRKIPIQHAKRMVGRKVMGGQSSFLPLKVNYSGVMPVIFASAILMFPGMLFETLAGATGYNFFRSISSVITDQRNWPYYVIFGGLILAFSYFWVSIMFKPIQIADDLKRSGGYIPGVRPGEPTARFLDFVMTRLTLAGSIFLVGIAIFPSILSARLGIPFVIAQFFGGTGALIAVGVMLDTMRQVETHLLQRHYDGFLKKGRLKGRSQRVRQTIDTGELRNLGQLWWPLGILFAIGIAAWVYQEFLI